MNTNANSQLPKINFWKTGNYQETIDRVYHGEKQVKNFARLLLERAQIEQKYEKELQAWATTWEKKIVQDGKEYGSARGALQATFEATRMVAETHDTMADELRRLARKNGSWRRAHYIKNVSDELRSALALKRRFESVQQNWIDLNKAEIDAKNAYMAACQNEEEAQRNDETNLSALEETSATLSQEYHEAVQSRAEYRDKYVEDMESIFKLAQGDEIDRKKFVKEQLLEMCTVLDTTKYEDSFISHEALQNILDEIDVEADVNTWDCCLGPTSSNQIPDVYE